MALGLLGIAGKGLKALGSRKKKPVNTTKLMARTDQPDKSQNPDISFDTVTPSTPLIPKGSAIDSLETGGPANFYTIRTKLITVDQILKDNLILDKVAVAIKKQEDEKEARKKAEEEIEGKKPKDKLALPVPKQVRSMWDHVQTFFKSLLMGLLLTQVLKFLPLLAKIVPLLMKAADFILEWGGKFLNVLVTVVDAGYKAYDWTRGKIEDVFGEEGAKKFDKIAGILNTVMNHIFTIGLGIIALSNEWNREDRERRKQQDIERQEIKNKRRKIKEQDVEWKKRRNQRLEQRRSFRRQQRINNLKKRFGIDQPPVQGPRQRNLFDKMRERFTPDPTIKPKPRGPNFFQRAWSGGTELVEGGIRNTQRAATWVSEGTVSNLKKTRGWLDDVGDSLYRNTIGKMDDWIKKNLDPSIILKRLAEEGDGILPKVARGMLGMADSPLMKGLMRGLPFLGDAIFFITDILSGKHWLRAFLRMLGAAVIDAGFYGLLYALGIAAPFTLGSSLIGSAALLAAYMAADTMAGSALGGDAGVGQLIGDKTADYFGVPEKAGEKGAKDGMWEQAFGKGGSAANQIAKAIDKVQLTQEQIAKISKFPGGMGVPVDSGKGAGTKLGEESDKKVKRRRVGPSYKTGSLTTIGPDGKPMTAAELEAAKDSTGHSRGTVVERKSSQATILPLDVNGVSKKVDSISEKASYEETDQAVAVVLVPDENDSGSIDSSGKGGLVLLPSGGGEDPHKKLYAGS